MYKIAVSIFALCLYLLSSQPVVAQGDISDPLLCAVVQVYECEAEGECQPVGIETAVLPRFINVNFEKQIISATEESGITDVSAIRNFERINGRLIIQGAENGRGWTIVVLEESGNMSATVSDEDVGFVVFGACTKN